MPTLLDHPATIPAEWTLEEWDALIAALTRRTLLGGGLALGLLTACGASSPPTATVPAMRTVDTVKGPVQIPAQPRRVVCVDYFAAYDLLDVGFTPVGVLDIPSAMLPPEYATSLQAITKVGTNREVNLEQVAQLQPDLILGFGLEPDLSVYDRLAAIAPTALFPFKTSADWARLAEQFADAVGRTSQLTALQRQYQDRAAAIRSTYAGVLGRTRWDIAYAAASDGKYYLYYPDSNGGKVLADAGVQFGSAAAGKAGTFANLSFEQISQLDDADVIVIPVDNSGQPSAATKGLLDQPAWQFLKAAKVGQTYPLSRLFPTSYKAALALLDELEGVVKKL
jgi:iron complex transport system substrate-binding protein